MKKALSILSAFFITSIVAYSQSGYLTDGIRFSENYYGSTARNTAIGSASSSLGGDLGSASINPAAVGVYRSSEFVFTPSLSASAGKSNFAGQKEEDMNYYFGLDNIGILLNFKNVGSLEGFSIAFGYNKLNEYNRNYIIKGNANVSIANTFLSYANNGPVPVDSLDSYWERVAYDARIISRNGNSYISPFTEQNLSLRHNYSVKGNLGEYFTAFGLNINNFVYFGASLNIRSGFYEETFSHNEMLSTGENLNFTYYRNSYYKAFNAKIGAIVRPIENLRLGVSLHTPTVGEVNMDIDTKATSSINGTSRSSQPPVVDNDEFTITSPLRFVSGISYLFGKIGLLSFDYEYADYHAIKFSEGLYENAIDSANNNVKQYLKATHNFRIGGELKFNTLYLRGGFAYYASPYTSESYDKNANTNIYSAGIGYRDADMFIDFAYSLKSYSSYYKMYDYANLENAAMKTNISNYLLTVGFKF